MGLLVMSLLGEWLCVRRELAEIPLSESGLLLLKTVEALTIPLSLKASFAVSLVIAQSGVCAMPLMASHCSAAISCAAVSCA